MPLTYHSYLKIEELLDLQQFRSPEEHDEMLFIIIHQAYELWFKQMLHELDYISNILEQHDDIQTAFHSMKRVLTILKVLVHQVDILETMTPLEFLSFRDYLETASGFQSYQWRELEFKLGLKSEIHIHRFPEGTDIRKRLQLRYNSPSIWHHFMASLKLTGYGIPSEVLNRPYNSSTTPSEEVQKVLLHIYKTNAPLAGFCELLVDLDEGIQEWRYRHVKMVERTIGSKKGTGGSAGVEYLKNSLFKPLFPDLWEIRSSFSK
ncbi:MAG: tryptophan 2,3-dioxygenase [Bacteroidetes bacterium HGW-Bacteroidetes-11]|jgi:tryptophan 2,3-dioxygenase|nr:MAG: tryptophan 2,3-dioxygenase [Bacteroidetes bacterium HGW-Bacteroidetes-11]